MKIPDLTILRSGTWESPLTKGYSNPRFVLNYELECFLGENGETFIDGVRYNLKPHTVIFCKPGQIRFSKFPLKSRFLYFTVCDADEEFNEFLDSLPDSPGENMIVSNLMSSMEQQHLKTDYKSELILKTNLLNCLVELPGTKKKDFRATLHPHQRDVYCAVSYMKDNIYNAKTVADFASCTGYSVPHFNAFFKELLNVTPYEYYMRLKAVEAKRLLLSGRYTVSEISIMLGFSSGSHFCAYFKKNCGMSPGEFVESFRHENIFDYENI